MQLRARNARIVSKLNYISCIGARYYRLPTGTFAAKDPRSVYDLHVHHVWQPPVWFDVEKRARKNLRHAAEKAFGLTPSLLGGKNEAVEELRIKSFFLPYWLVRAAIFGPIDFTFMRGSMEGRIGVDITFSFTGIDHFALKSLHFLSPSTEVLEQSVAKTLPVPGFIYVPFSQSPPLHFKSFFENMTQDRHLTLSSRVKLRSRSIKSRIAARPVLEPILLGEYRYQGRNLTVACCLRLGADATRVYSNGEWVEGGALVGPSKSSFSIAWKDNNDPRAVDYKEIEISLQRRTSQLLEAAASQGIVPASTSHLWESAAVSAEGFENIRKWREAKLNLWQEGCEIA